MDATTDAQVLELLAWIASRRRTYAEAMEVWQSQCPRHPVWEEALADGLVRIVRTGADGTRRTEVALTARGEAALNRRRAVAEPCPGDSPLDVSAADMSRGLRT